MGQKQTQKQTVNIHLNTEKKTKKQRKKRSKKTQLSNSTIIAPQFSHYSPNPISFGNNPIYPNPVMNQITEAPNNNFNPQNHHRSHFNIQSFDNISGISNLNHLDSNKTVRVRQSISNSDFGSETTDDLKIPSQIIFNEDDNSNDREYFNNMNELKKNLPPRGDWGPIEKRPFTYNDKYVKERVPLNSLNATQLIRKIEKKGQTPLTNKVSKEDALAKYKDLRSTDSDNTTVYKKPAGSYILK